MSFVIWSVVRATKKPPRTSGRLRSAHRKAGVRYGIMATKIAEQAFKVQRMSAIVVT
jgi:hypothetical protein